MRFWLQGAGASRYVTLQQTPEHLLLMLYNQVGDPRSRVLPECPSPKSLYIVSIGMTMFVYKPQSPHGGSGSGKTLVMGVFLPARTQILDRGICED